MTTSKSSSAVQLVGETMKPIEPEPRTPSRVNRAWRICSRSARSTGANADAGRSYSTWTGDSLKRSVRNLTSPRETHRWASADRPASFVTIEEPVAIAEALESLEKCADVVVLDCLTLWVSNLMNRALDDPAIMAEADRLVAALSRVSFGAAVVTGEVGAGIVPVNPAARRFRDLLGWINQKVARASDRVILMAAGYPIVVK